MGAESFIVADSYVGEGNPAVAEAVYHSLVTNGYNTRAYRLDLSFLLARLFHRRMSGSSRASDQYSHNGTRLREFGMKVLGPQAFLETLVRNFSMFTDGNGGSRTLLAVQEHQFGTFPQILLERMFARRFMVVPDVEPKESGIRIMEKRGMRPVVWNERAKEKMDKMDLDPLLVQPPLPCCFLNRGQLPQSTEEYVLVKTSGSGAPVEQVRQIEESLKKLGIPFMIYLPEVVVTNNGLRRRSISLGMRIRSFYNRLLTEAPKLLISCPSELTAVAAVLNLSGMNWLTLPPRGSHEVVNRDWARERGIGNELFVPGKDVQEVIKKAFYETRTTVPQEKLGLGSVPLHQALSMSTAKKT